MALNTLQNSINVYVSKGWYSNKPCSLNLEIHYVRQWDAEYKYHNLERDTYWNLNISSKFKKKRTRKKSDVIHWLKCVHSERNYNDNYTTKLNEYIKLLLHMSETLYSI